MAALIPCELIARHVGELYRCTPLREYIAIQTPFIFPDGDIIELYYKETINGAGLLTDLGETLRWLSGQTPSEKRTKRHLQLIEDTCSTHRVRFFDDEVSVAVPNPASMAESITRLIQAAIRITDVSFTFRHRQFESFADEVADFLSEKSITTTRNHEVEGTSGKTWKVDFKTHIQRDALFFALSTGNRAQAQRLTDHVVAAFHDLRNLHNQGEQVHFISLVDDHSDIWQPEDFKRMEDVSATVASWSRPDEFVEYLRAALLGQV